MVQANLLLVEDANDVAADFDELVWIFFNLCQSTEVFKIASSFMVQRRYPLVGIVRFPPEPEIVSVRESFVRHGSGCRLNFFDGGKLIRLM